MSKGSQLGELLDKGQVLHKQMRQLFIKNGLDTMDLTALQKISEEDYNSWRALHTESNALSKQMCDVVNPKVTDDDRKLTGVKINEREICAGDILREWIADSQEDNGGFWWYGVVEMRKGCWVVANPHFNYRDEMPELLFDSVNKMEYAGNVCQNPELIIMKGATSCL